MAKYGRMPRDLALIKYLKLEKDFKSVNKFIKFILMEIELTKRDHEWRRRHVRYTGE